MSRDDSIWGGIGPELHLEVVGDFVRDGYPQSAGQKLKVYFERRYKELPLERPELDEQAAGLLTAIQLLLLA